MQTPSSTRWRGFCICERQLLEKPVKLWRTLVALSFPGETTGHAAAPGHVRWPVWQSPRGAGGAQQARTHSLRITFKLPPIQ